MNPFLPPVRILYRGTRHLGVIDVTRLMHLSGDRCGDCVDPAGYQIRAVPSEELQRLLEFHRAPAQIGGPGRMSGGCHAVVAAFRQDRVVSFSWFAKQTVGGADNVSRAAHLGTSIDLPAGTAFVYNAWTDPEHRGKRLLGSIVAYALRHQILGALSLLASIDWTNQKSIGAFQFIGMESLGTIVRIGRGRMQISVIPSAAGRLGVRVAADAPGYKVAY